MELPFSVKLEMAKIDIINVSWCYGKGSRAGV